MGFFLEDENKPVPDYFTAVSLQDIFNYTPKDVQFKPDTFKQKFLDFTWNEDFFSQIVGINWTYRNPSDIKLPQRLNAFKYFIPEYLYSNANEFFKLKSIGTYDFFFKIENNGKSVKTEDFQKKNQSYDSRI